MNMEAMRAVEVAVVVALAQLAREQKVEPLKSIPVPLPSVDSVVEEKARCERENTSVMPAFAASTPVALSAGAMPRLPQARVVEAIGELVPMRKNEPPWLPKILPCTPRLPPKRPPCANCANASTERLPIFAVPICALEMEAPPTSMTAREVRVPTATYA